MLQSLRKENNYSDMWWFICISVAITEFIIHSNCIEERLNK